MSKIAKSAVLLMMATMIAKILGFVRDQVLSYAYGLSMYTDVYITSMGIPTTIFAAIGVAISTTFIPLYCDISRERGEESANEFTNNVMGIVFILCLIISILGLVFTEGLVKVFAIGFTGEKLELAVSFTRILISSVIFIGLSNVASAYLQVKNNFVIPGLVTIPQNIITILFIILSLKFGINTMVWGSLIGILSAFLFQIPFIFKSGYKFKAKVNFKDKYIKKIAILVAPVFLGVAVNQINTIVDRTLASTLHKGLLTSLSYANRLNEFVLAMFITSIATVIYPMLSKLSIDNDKNEFEKSVITSMNSVILLVIPISVGAIVLAKPVVRLLFERGAFNSYATDVTAGALMMYAIGMTAFGLRSILDKVFYSLQDTKTPMKNGIITVVLNIVLNLIFIQYLGHVGLALATSISGIICVILFIRSLKRKINSLNTKKIIITLIKSIISAILMGLCVYISFNKIGVYLGNGIISQIISLAIPTLIGIIVYAICIIVLKVEETNMILNIINGKLKKIKKEQ